MKIIQWSHSVLIIRLQIITEATASVFYELRGQILKCLADSLHQLTIIVTNSLISDPFSHAPHLVVKRIVIRRVGRPHMRGNTVKKLSSSHFWDFLAVRWFRTLLEHSCGNFNPKLDYSHQKVWYTFWFTFRSSSKV